MRSQRRVRQLTLVIVITIRDNNACMFIIIVTTPNDFDNLICFASTI